MGHRTIRRSREYPTKVDQELSAFDLVCGGGTVASVTCADTVWPVPKRDDQDGHVAWLRHKGIGRVALLAVLAGLTTLFYYVSMRILVPNSDSATVVLEGESMAAGHLTLHGWRLSLDSFWGVDAVLNTIAVLIAGVRSVLLYLVPAFIASLVVVLGILIACVDRTRWATVAAVATVVALLGLPSNDFGDFFLESATHVGTALWCLIAFLLLSRRPKGNWLWVGWFIGVGFLAAGLLGDLQMVVLGVAPVLVVGLAETLRGRSWRKGTWLAAASVVSVALAFAVRGLAEVVGTFSIGKERAASDSQMLHNFRNLPRAVLHMFAVQQDAGEGFSAAEAVHLIGLALVTAAIMVALIRLVTGIISGSRRSAISESGATDDSRSRLLDELLLFGCAGSIAVFVRLSANTSVSFDRYLTAAVIFGCILAGRMVGEIVSRLKAVTMLRSVAAVGVACIAVLAVGIHTTLEQPVVALPAAQLGEFLESHGFHEGIGDYWSASITTVATDRRVTIRPVITDPSTGRIVRYGRQSDGSWYTGEEFQFLVFSTFRPLGISDVSAVDNFGPAKHTYAVGTFRVLVWGHSLKVPQSSYDIG